MEETLHKQKIQILGRLIKESSLTLEEALLLLQAEEEKDKEEDVVTQPSSYHPSYGGTHPLTVPGYWPYQNTGTITIPLAGSSLGIGVATTTGTNIFNTTATNSGTSLTNSTTAVVLQELEKAIEDASI